MDLGPKQPGPVDIGAILSGVLIPIFQTTQETIKWTRQNRYDNLKYRLESARSAMKELVLTHAFVAESFERARAVQSSSIARDKTCEDYRVQALDMQNRRFQQNAKFVGTLGLLDESSREQARDAFNIYLATTQQYMNVLNNWALSDTPDSGGEKKQEDKIQTALRSLAKEVDVDYARVLGILSAYIHRMEAQGEKYS